MTTETKLATLVNTEVRPLTSGEVMHAPVEKLSLGERVEAFAILQWMEKKLEERKAALRERLLADAEQVGKPNEKGGFKISHEGCAVTKEARTSKSPNDGELRALLTEASIGAEQVFDKVMVEQFNPSKLEQLVSLGKLDAEAVKALYKVTYALKVSPSESIELLLEEATQKHMAVAAAHGATPVLTEGEAQPKGKKTKK